MSRAEGSSHIPNLWMLLDIMWLITGGLHPSMISWRVCIPFSSPPFWSRWVSGAGLALQGGADV